MKPGAIAWHQEHTVNSHPSYSADWKKVLCEVPRDLDQDEWVYRDRVVIII
jgi:hypothetical protein